MLDIPVTAFVSIALGAFYMAQQEPGKGWNILYGTAVALAILTKGVVGLIPVIVSGVFLTATSWRLLFDRRYLLGTGIAFMLGAPWHL
jgi:4-amino-4-deoxy-L-arabinose transferase-like glycosyltransferase